MGGNESSIVWNFDGVSPFSNFRRQNSAWLNSLAGSGAVSVSGVAGCDNGGNDSTGRITYSIPCCRRLVRNHRNQKLVKSKSPDKSIISATANTCQNWGELAGLSQDCPKNCAIPPPYFGYRTCLTDFKDSISSWASCLQAAHP